MTRENSFWTKVALVILPAAVLGFGAGFVRHEAKLTGVDRDIAYIKQSQERIERAVERLVEKSK